MRSPSTGSAKMAGGGATLSRGLSLPFCDPVCGLSFLAFFVCFLCFSFVGKFFCFLCLTPLAFLVIFVACKAGGMALWWWIYWALAVHLHLGISLSWFVLIIVFPGFHWKSLMFPGLRFFSFFLYVLSHLRCSGLCFFGDWMPLSGHRPWWGKPGSAICSGQSEGGISGVSCTN